MLRLFLSILVLSSCCLSAVADEPTIRFDGVRFAGMWYYGTQDEEEIAAQFPIGHEYGDHREIRDDGYSVEVQSDLTKRMIEAMQAEAKPGGERLLDRLAWGEGSSSAQDGNAWFVACAINYEHVETQKLPLMGKTITKVLTEIGFDVILCNFADRRIAALLPGRIQRIDAVEGTDVTDERKQESLRHLYEDSLLPEFMRIVKLPCSTFSPSYTIGIGEIRIGEELLKDTPESVKPSLHSYYSSLISSVFYEELGVPVLPYSGGNDQVYCSMRENLSDVHELKRRAAQDTNDARREGKAKGGAFVLQRPDCQLNIYLPKFVTQVVNKVNKRQNQLAFVAGCELSIVDPAGKGVFTQRFFGDVQALYTTDVNLGTPWIYYQAASVDMLRKATTELKKNPATKKLIIMSSVDTDKVTAPTSP